MDSESKDEPLRMRRQDWWRKQYREDPYLVGFTDLELDLRFADVMTNNTVLTDEGKIGIAGMDWIEKLTHVWEELGIRGRGFPHNSVVGERLASPRPETPPDVYFNRVSYIDPALLGENNHIRDVALVKHMRFAYQFEHRFVAKSPVPGPLERRDLELGSLEDIAELLVPPEEVDRAA